jgi:hypothetical protein
LKPLDARRADLDRTAAFYAIIASAMSCLAEYAKEAALAVHIAPLAPGTRLN